MESLDDNGFHTDFDVSESTGELPSLESILKEDDASAYQFEEIASPFFSNSDMNMDETDGSVSMTSVALPPLPTNINVMDLLKTKRPSMHGSILRHVILKKISQQMLDACKRRDAGLPTAIAISNLLVLGTSHGLSLVFEPKHQVLKLVLGSTSDGDNFGAVTALGQYNYSS